MVPLAEDVLVRLGLRGHANKFVEVIRVQVGNKERLVPILLEHLQFPLDVAVLEYIDIARRDIRVVPLQG